MLTAVLLLLSAVAAPVRGPFAVAGRGPEVCIAPSPVPSTDGPNDTLHFDGANATGVGMSGGGWFKAGVRFTAPFRCILKSVLFYQFERALDGYVFLYDGMNDTTPGALWDSLVYFTEPPGTWSRVDLPEDRFLENGTDFWVCPEFACGPNHYPMGIDSGPLVWHRNFIYWTSSLGWVHVPRVGINSNWNVRAVVSRADPRDVTPTQVVSPSSQTWPGPLEPRIKVRNVGESGETDIPVTVWIDSAGTRVYEETVTLAGPLGPREYDLAVFPTWHPGPVGAEYELTAFTHLAGDFNFRNDTIQSTIRVAGAAFSDTIIAKRVTSGPPEVDGVVEPGEWADARAYDISDTLGQGLIPRPPGSNIVRFLYDDDFLYLACEFPTVGERLDGDFFALCTDEDHSGTWNRPDSCEGRHTAFYTTGQDSLIFEAILTTLPYIWRMDGQCPDALSASSTSGGRLQFEAKIPFGSRRGDLDMAPGDTAGVFMYSMANYGSDCYGWWPQRITQGNWANPVLYSPLILSTEVGVGEEGSTPYAMRHTLQVRPNPVTVGIATVSFSSAQRSSFSTQRSALRVFDALGRCVLVRQLAIGDWSLGIPLDCRRLSSGVYLVRLETAAGTASTPLVILD